MCRFRWNDKKSGHACCCIHKGRYDRYDWMAQRSTCVDPKSSTERWQKPGKRKPWTHWQSADRCKCWHHACEDFDQESTNKKEPVSWLRCFRSWVIKQFKSISKISVLKCSYVPLPTHRQSDGSFCLNRSKAIIWQGHKAFCCILETSFSKRLWPILS